MDKRQRYKPQSVVTFYSEEGDLVVRGTNDTNAKEDDAITYIQTTRHLGDDSSTFVIELARTKDWHKAIASNDLVRIDMHRPPEANTTVFIGLVDDVRKTVSLVGENITRTITVSGRGVAKAFIQFDIGMVPEADYVPSSVGWLLAAGVTVSQSPASTVIQGIWDVIASKVINYEFSNGYSLFDLISYNLVDRQNMVLLDDSNVAEWQGSLWGLMKDIAEEPFYELFWEISNGLPVMYMRPTPFNSKEWNALKRQEINDDVVIHDEVGRSDVETYTLYSVGAQTLFSTNDPYKTFGHRPLWYPPYSRKYGIRRLHVETKYMSTADEPEDDLVDRMYSLMEDLFNWNIKNNSFYNGNIIVQGNPKYKIGERLLYTSQEDNSMREYYIQGVTHEFRRFELWTTNLEVIRGCHPNDRFSSPVGQATEYSGLGILEFNPELAKQLMASGGLEDSYVDYVEGGGGGAGGGTPGTQALGVVAGAKAIMNNGINGVKVRYVFGGSSPNTGSLDCSSFTQYVFKKYANMDIGRVTGQQLFKGTASVAKADLIPGDLVFFKNTYNSTHAEGVSHVGIYIGGGQFIHNSSGANGVTVGNLNDSYWKSHWLRGRRMFASSSSGGGSGGTGSPNISGSKVSGLTGGGSGAKPSGSAKTFTATAYGAEKINLGVPDWYKPTYKTATGVTPVGGRTIATDPSVIPMGSKVYIECPSYPAVNGWYLAEDKGGAIKGNRIDIYANDIAHLGYDTMKARADMLKFGKRSINVWVVK